MRPALRITETKLFECTDSAEIETCEMAVLFMKAKEEGVHLFQHYGLGVGSYWGRALIIFII